ncbi:MAG: helix-turn-helix domain-containing protein, partial [Bacilli bacterium]
MENVGEILKQKREELKLSIDDVVTKTKIQKIYIDAIESNNFSFFVGQDFYQQVFVGNYANFLGFDKNEVLEKLESDRTNFDAGKLSVNKKISRNSNSFIEKQVLTRAQNQVDTQETKFEELEVNPVEEEVIVNNETEIDQLLAEIDGAINLDDQPVDELELTQPILDNLIFEQIEKIEQEAKGTPEIKEEVVVKTVEPIEESPIIETGVIDIVGEIEIEEGQSIDIELAPTNVEPEVEIQIEEAGVSKIDVEPSLAMRMADLENDAAVVEETVLGQANMQVEVNPKTNPSVDGQLFINDN